MKKTAHKTRRSLTLSRKTLRTLSDDRLANVGGGTMEGMIGEYAPTRPITYDCRG